MGAIDGFKKYKRQELKKEPVEKRIRHWKEFIIHPSDDALREQGARCMDCGIPFCHWSCPVANIIPDWNDLVYRDRWQEALERLIETNNFPEFTGRLCPAPCEHSCVLEINDSAVTIKNIELAIIERAYKQGWMRPRPPVFRTGKKVAVIGSGPAGLACADQLNKAGHSVTVFEKNEDIGGILVLGIPDFKIEKSIIKRRIDLMRKEGIIFKVRSRLEKTPGIKQVVKKYDAVVLTCGAEQPRDLRVPGRELTGVYQAMEYLTQQNRINKKGRVSKKGRINARNKNVIVLGGGDTGADCVGTANRQGARSVKQFEILPCLPCQRDENNPWPQWAFVFKPSTSHEEGVEQDYCIMTQSLSGKDGKLKKLHAVKLEYGSRDFQTGRCPSKKIPGSEFSVDCDLLILAMGFLGPVKKGIIDKLGVDLDERGNVKTDEHMATSIPGVFAAGDMHRGQSLVVWAIAEGRIAAENVDAWLATSKKKAQLADTLS